MKTLIKITLVLLIPLLYFAVFSGFKSSENEAAGKTVLGQIPPPPAPRSFTNCIFNLGPTTSYNYWILNQLGNYSGLHFNTIHAYDRIDRDSNGTYDYGRFDQDLTDLQKGNINTLTNAVSNAELDFWYERIKISKLCYAQRLIYEIKDPDNANLVNNGFCYQNTSGCYEIDQNRTVLHLSPNPITNCNEWDAAPRYIASGIYENLQHGDLYVFNIQYADEGVWHVKPMMRIPQNTPDEVEVIRIEIFNYNNNSGQGTPIKTVIVKGKNFNVKGSYTDSYTFSTGEANLEITGGNGTIHTPPELNDGQDNSNFRSWATNCKTDFKVKWMGEVEVWFDKMTVDDKYGNELFNGIHDDKITQELDYYFTQPYRTYTYFADEVTYSQFEAIKHVKRKISEYCAEHEYELPHLNIASSNYHNIRGYKDNTIEHRIMYEELQPYSVNIDAHEIWSLKMPNTVPNPCFPSGWIASNYNEYTQILQLKGFGDRNSITPETEEMGNYDPAWWGSLVYQIVKAREQRETYSQNTKFIMQPQIHGVLKTSNGGLNWFEGGREPTNEEIQAQAMLSIAHGAEGICWFIYQSFGPVTNPPGTDEYTFGLLNIDLSFRNSNLYGQTKWNYVRDMNIKIEKWIPTLNNITWQAGYSVHSEYGSGAFTGYIHDIASIDPEKSGVNPCAHDSINDGGGYLWLDCPDERYWEMGFFTPSEINTKYFMMVNRRCVPSNNDDDRGDVRILRIKFDAANLANFTNWKLTDIAKPRSAVIFSKNYTGYVDLNNSIDSLGLFLPGEGKLFKLEPVMQSGGNLVADDTIPSGSDFICEDTVWTNGYNLTIEDGVTIHFSDSAKFIVHGGTFQMGIAQHSGSNTINMDAAHGSWKGFVFDSATVKIYGVNFSELANDSISMLTFIDCPVIDLRSNSFSLGSNNNVAAIDVNYSGSYGSSITNNVYIANNTFTGSNAVLPHVKVMAYSGITTPVIVEGNNFTGTSTALFLNNIQGGAIKSNTFTGFGTAVTALSSSLDVFSNTVSSSSTYGLEALEGTELKMSYSGGLLVGGRNNITNSSSNSDNIYLENSYFLMDEGENIFDIGTSSYHLYGWFPESYSGSYDETKNCFKVEGSVVDPPVHYVTLGEQGNQITEFVFYPYLTGCSTGGEGDMMVINLGNDIYDTVGIKGEGGSFSGNYILTPKIIYDSISISMRFRNYANVKSLCLYLLNTYPDSMQALGAVSKLYLAVSKTDTTTQGITDLKTLYENLILNHSGNISLIKRCNYYIQKCKVLLHQYSSALSGFQQIINNNPASYEGLTARWDYMATSLMMQGQGGSEGGKSEKAKVKKWIWGFESDKSDESDKFDNDKFTKEERKQIKQAVTTALEISKSTEKKREIVLTELSTRGDIKATKQLEVLKSLEQTVKVEKPKNIVEHLKIVSGDIQKVFVNPNAGKNTNTIFIPQEFNLSQNYPNPFNPVTKINYDIPKNSIVKLTIYDILGKEVVKLVNNEFKQPGRYVVEFNGKNFASGVYFYRIEAGDFVKSKKMVLVK